GRAEICLVHPDLLSAKADHDTGVLRQRAALDALEAARPQRGEQLIGVARAGLDAEVELRGIRMDPSASNPVSYRLKHLTGPGTKFSASSDHRRVDTSDSSRVILVLFP